MGTVISAGPQPQRAEPAEPDFSCTFPFKNFSQLSEEVNRALEALHPCVHCSVVRIMLGTIICACVQEQYSETFTYEQQQWYMTIRLGDHKGVSARVPAV